MSVIVTHRLYSLSDCDSQAVCIVSVIVTHRLYSLSDCDSQAV